MKTRSVSSSVPVAGVVLGLLLAGCGRSTDPQSSAMALEPTALVIPPPDDGGSPTFDTTRRSRFAARFAGAGGAISIANSPALEPATFTIEMWVRIESTPWGFTPLITSPNTNEWNTADGYGMKFEADRFYVRVARASNLASAAWAPYVPPLHRWVHVAGTFDGDVARAYIDGDLVAEFPDARPVWYGPRGLVFGTGYHSQWGGYAACDGLMDEIRIWNHARSAADIRTAMRQELTGQEAGLLGYWNFEGVLLGTDTSPHGHHGTLAGNVQRVGQTPF